MSVCVLYHVLHKEIDMIDKIVIVFYLLNDKWINCKYSSHTKRKLRQTSRVIRYSIVSSTVHCHRRIISSQFASFFWNATNFYDLHAIKCTHDIGFTLAFVGGVLCQWRHLKKKYYKETQTDFFVPISKLVSKNGNDTAFAAFANLANKLTSLCSKTIPMTQRNKKNECTKKPYYLIYAKYLDKINGIN